MPAGARLHSRAWLPWVLGAAMIAPPIVAVCALAFRTWHPTDDLAVIDLRVRDVFTAHPPLTGLFSRPGWNHPGPAMFWLIALVARPFGNPTWATRAGAALVEAGFMVWLAIATARAGLRWLLAAAAVTGLLYVAIDPGVIRHPWNLHIPLIGFVLVVFLAGLVATGRPRHLIGLAIASTIVVQTHVGFALPTAAAIVFALACVAVDVRHHGAPPKWRSTALITIVVSFVLWLPPLIDVLANWPGNLGTMVKYFATGNYSHVGFSSATGILASEFKWVPQWLGGNDHLAPLSSFARTSSQAWLLVPVALLVAAGLAAWRTGRVVDRRQVGLAATLFVVAVVAISRADEPRAYTFQWRVIVATFLVVVCIQALIAWLPRPDVTALVAGGLAIAVVVWGAVDLSIGIVEGGYAPLEAREPALTAALPAIDRVPRHQRILVVQVGDTTRGLFDGVVNELARRGVDVRVDPTLGRVFGGQRRGVRKNVDQVWLVTELGSQIPRLLERRGARLVDSSTPLPRAQEDELRRLQAELRQQLRTAGRAGVSQHLDNPLIPLLVANVPGVDHEVAKRVAVLDAIVGTHHDCRCGIVSVPGGRALRKGNAAASRAQPVAAAA